MNNHNFGCDFGSYHLKIYHRDADAYLIQHNMVAVQDKKGLLAFGSRLFYIAAVFYCDVWRT